MSEITEHTPGTFSWVDAGLRDVAAGKAFYSEVLGFSFEDMPMGEGQMYSMATVRGKHVGAIYPQQKQMQEQGVPPHWLSYITVKSADETAAKVEGLGGKLISPPFDVMEAGRMAVLSDPTGAVFAIWQPKKTIGAQLLNEPGAPCWNELLTRDTDKAGAFYKGLFGWEPNAKDMGNMIYTVFGLGDRQTGGMMKITPEMGPMPSVWVVYFGTDNTDAAVERATRGGGKVLAPPMDVPNVGRFSMLQDPQGAAFAVIKFAEQPAS